MPCRVRDAGVDFTLEPVVQAYGIDCALRDPSGNQIRITQPTPMSEITEDDPARWKGSH